MSNMSNYVIAYLSEKPGEKFPNGNDGAKKTLESKLPSTIVEVFQKPSGAVGINWDGPLFSTQYDLIISGVIMSIDGLPEPEKGNYGNTTGIYILEKVRESEQNINYDTPWLIMSPLTAPHRLDQIRKLLNSRSVLLDHRDRYSESEVIKTIEKMFNISANV